MVQLTSKQKQNKWENKMKITIEPQNSSVIKQLVWESHNERKGSMTVLFTSCAVYRYPSVSLSHIEDLVMAKSIGAEFAIFKKCVDARQYERLMPSHTGQI